MSSSDWEPLTLFQQGGDTERHVECSVKGAGHKKATCDSIDTKCPEQANAETQK